MEINPQRKMLYRVIVVMVLEFRGLIPNKIIFMEILLEQIFLERKVLKMLLMEFQLKMHPRTISVPLMQVCEIIFQGIKVMVSLLVKVIVIM